MTGAAPLEPVPFELVPFGWVEVAVLVASPVTVPVQPTAGQSSEAEVRAVPLPPGKFFAFGSVLAGWPLLAVVLVMAVVATPHPLLVPEEQEAWVVESPEASARWVRVAWLVVVAVQPVEAQRAVACD